MEPSYLETPQGRRIAYHFTPGDGPGVVFLGGFRSDMDGTKAVYLEDWAKKEGRAFLRLDYSGHGKSSGEFLDGAIGDWFEDAAEVIKAVTSGPQVIVGSSMGGWIALLIARDMPERVASLVGIAAAPDFTEDAFYDSFTEDERVALVRDGRIERASDYSDDPYIITQRLIEEGRKRLVLRDPLPLPFPVRLLHGTADKDVIMSVPLRIIEHAEGEDIQLTFVKGADHRFSTQECLQMITETVSIVLEQDGRSEEAPA
ncbi:MAG: alpha/beta hydrolase [Pseudomonadota bacterium]